MKYRKIRMQRVTYVGVQASLYPRVGRSDAAPAMNDCSGPLPNRPNQPPTVQRVIIANAARSVAAFAPVGVGKLITHSALFLFFPLSQVTRDQWEGDFCFHRYNARWGRKSMIGCVDSRWIHTTSPSNDLDTHCPNSFIHRAINE